MKRAVVAALALGCAGIAPALASAAPVDSGRMASVSVSVPLPSGDTLELDIQGAQMSAGPLLAIHAQHCDDDQGCMADDDYLSPLSAGALSIDPSDAVARLHTTLDGRVLDVVWRPADGVVVGAGYVDGTGSAVTASHFFGDAASVTVQYAGNTCAGAGAVGQGLAANAGLADDSATSPISKLHLPAAAVLRCER
jgi:hypothetical protein